MFTRRRAAVLAVAVLGISTATASTASNPAGTFGHHGEPQLLTPGEEGRVVVKEVDVSQPGEIATAYAWVNGAYHPVRYPLRRMQITYADGRRTHKILQGAPLDQLPPQDPALAHVQPTEEQFRQVQDALGEHPTG